MIEPVVHTRAPTANVRVVLARSPERPASMTSVAVSLKVGGWVPMLRWTRSASRPAVTLHEATAGGMRDLDRLATAALRETAKKKRKLVKRDVVARVIEGVDDACELARSPTGSARGRVCAEVVPL
jgi:hypothetical protein